MTEERQKRIQDVLHHRQNDLTVVLENVHDPHNIAAVMRSCDAVGISEIYVLNTGMIPHPKFGKRSSSSAQKWVNVHQFSEAKYCFEEIRKKYSKIYSTHLDENAVSLYDLELTTSCALVFGNEHSGITKESLAYCDGNFIIPQVGMIQSLNISVACAVSIFEAFRQKKAAGHYDKNKLSIDQKNELLDFWEVDKNDFSLFY